MSREHDSVVLKNVHKVPIFVSFHRTWALEHQGSQLVAGSLSYPSTLGLVVFFVVVVF